MFRLRPFRNSDPPALAEIWQAQPASRGLVQPVAATALEHFVWSKPYFDREGLIVAEHEGRPVGFVHAGFGPNEDLSDVSYETGLLCMLQALPDFESVELRQQLMQAAEKYMIQRGAKVLLAGSHPPYIPFYHGMRNTCEPVGILTEDTWVHEGVAEFGYQPDGERLALNCTLAEMRPTFDRTQRQLARTLEVQPHVDHDFLTWWDTCSHGPTPRCCFQLRNKKDGTLLGILVWWNLNHGVWEASRSMVGMRFSRIEQDKCPQELVVFLFHNALKQLRAGAYAVVQVQIKTTEESRLAFYRRLGFEEVAHGISYRKEVDA